MAQDDIQGQVVDGAGNPVSGAIVELTKSYQSNPVERGDVFRTTTDSNGNYIFIGHQEGDGTTQEWHVSCYNHDGTAYVNSFNNPGVTADLPSNAIPDGEHVYVTERTNNTARHDSLSTPFDLSTATDEGTITGFTDPRAVDIRPDGTSIFICDNKDNSIEQFDLSTPYDLSTASSGGTFSTITPHGIDISPSGEDAILTNDTSNEVLYGQLSTPWDITSMSTSVVFTISGNTTAASFGDEGNVAVYISKQSVIQELTLSTPYDVSTATETATTPLDGSDERGVEFGDDGNLLFTTDRDEGKIREYSLSTPFDITTRSLNTSFITDVSDTNGISFVR
jgi:hypothetical protein